MKETGSSILLGAPFLKKVDEWRRKQRDRPSRAAAIERLAKRGGLSGSASLPRKDSKRKAADMAARQIERSLDDQAVDNEERARRKRRLIEGPREFRDIRSGRSKSND